VDEPCGPRLLGRRCPRWVWKAQAQDRKWRRRLEPSSRCGST